MNRCYQAIQRLQENLSVVKICWDEQRQRGVGVVRVSLNDTPTYLTKSEIDFDTYRSASFCEIDRLNPDWILALVEVSGFLHKNFSWQLLALDERHKIQVFHFPFGFQLYGSKTTIFIGGKRTIIENRSTEGIESVSFFERGDTQ